MNSSSDGYNWGSGRMREEEGVFSELLGSLDTNTNFLVRKKRKKKALTLAACLNMFFIGTVMFWNRTATVIEQ